MLPYGNIGQKIGQTSVKSGPEACVNKLPDHGHNRTTGARKYAHDHLPIDAVNEASMSGPRFDLSINLGHVLTISGVILTMVIGWTNFDARLRAVEKTLETSTQTLVEQVRQGARLDAIEDRLERLERP